METLPCGYFGTFWLYIRKIVPLIIFVLKRENQLLFVTKQLILRKKLKNDKNSFFPVKFAKYAS